MLAGHNGPSALCPGRVCDPLSLPTVHESSPIFTHVLARIENDECVPWLVAG